MKSFYFLFALFLSINLSGQIINIPDSEFKARLLTCNILDAEGNYVLLNSNGDNEIEVAEALVAYELAITNLPVQNVQGIEYFTNLRKLDLFMTQVTSIYPSSLVNIKELYLSHNQLESVNVVGLSNLETLLLDDNQLQSLNLTGLSNLQCLYCRTNILSSLDATPAVNLISLQCDFNELTSLNIDGLTRLEALGCVDNNLQTLNVSSSQNLEVLHCGKNELAELDLSGLNLSNLTCNENNLTHLDVNGMTNLTILACADNNLASLYIKEIAYNGGEDDYLEFFGNENLEIICASLDKIDLVQTIVDSYGYTECSVADCVLSSNELTFSKNIKCYPNPTTDIINFSNFNCTYDSISIYNNVGQILKKIDISGELISIEVLELSSGIYYGEIISSNNLNKSKFKFIKN